MKAWKKTMALLMSSLTLFACGCGADGKNSINVDNSETEQTCSSGIDSADSQIPEEETSWYEERSGYKFCGYYEDEDFTKSVMKTVTQETAKNYYPKYQIDKVQQIACVPTEVDSIIYAYDFTTALAMYLREVYGFYDRTSSIFQVAYSDYGIPYENEDVFVNDVHCGLYEMTDNSKTVPYDYKNIQIPYYQEYGGYVYDEETGEYIQKLYTRNNKWKAYIAHHNDVEGGDEVLFGEIDGWYGAIIDDEFAVIFGREQSWKNEQEYVEEITIPSIVMGKYPVKEVSICKGGFYCLPNAKTLTIPSSVENVRLYQGNVEGYVIENLIIEEGVKTVRMDSVVAKNVSLPSSAYYVDVNGMIFREALYHDQSITVAQNGHYYTENGCLYSKEGDLVFQFANRGQLDFYISKNAKRVLPLSINGINKNIHIPKNLEYFDGHAFLGGLRGDWWKNSKFKEAPMLLIDSPIIAKTYFWETIRDMGCPNFPATLYSNKIDMKPVLEEAWELLVADESFDEVEDELQNQEIAYMKELFLNGINPSIEYPIEEEENLPIEVEGDVLTVKFIEGYSILFAVDYEKEMYIGNQLDMCIDASQFGIKGIFRLGGKDGYPDGALYTFEMYTYLDTPLLEIEDLSFDSVVFEYAKYHGIAE